MSTPASDWGPWALVALTLLAAALGLALFFLARACRQRAEALARLEAFFDAQLRCFYLPPRPRRRPNAFIREARVVGGTPSSSAAPPGP